MLLTANVRIGEYPGKDNTCLGQFSHVTMSLVSHA